MNMDLATATSRREALLFRINAYIASMDSQEVQALDFIAIKERMDRYDEQFSTLENANAIVAGAITVAADRQLVWDEMHDIMDRFIAAQIKSKRLFVAKTPAVAPSPATEALLGSAATGAAAAAQAVPPSITVQMPFHPHNVPQTWGTFNGNPLEWQDFRSRFELAVHSRTDIPDDHKLAFLRNALKGLAAQASKGWTLKAENYKKCWDELVEKNSKRYPVASAYLSRFFAIKKMPEPATSAQLQRLSNEANELVRQLRDLEYQPDRYDLVIVHAIKERMNDTYQDKWETERGDNDDPTIEQITKFLDKHATKQVNKGLAYSGPHPDSRASHPQLQSVVHRPTGQGRPGSAQKYPCGACGSFEHMIFVCPEFKPLSLSERKKVVSNMSLCPNCLKRGHNKEDCYDMSRCNLKECAPNNRHNSMLCPGKNRTHHVATANFDDRYSSSSSSHDGQGMAYRAGYGRGSAFKRLGDKQA